MSKSGIRLGDCVDVSCKYSHRTIKGGVGHNLPQEGPEAFADTIIEVDGYR